VTDDFGSLSAELRRVFEGPWRLGNDDFASLALRVFAYQFTHNTVYGAFCRGRGVTPDSITEWTEIPAVPTSAFKELPIFCGDPTEAEAVFRTSGTTQGGRTRGRHHVKDLSLYEASALPNARRHLLAGLDESPVLVSLVPAPRSVPDSSLSRMARLIGDRLCTSADWCTDPGEGLQVEALHRALDRATRAGRPVLLFGTAFAFVHWLDALEEAGAAGSGVPDPLPPGSRIMETGGFKGRSREVPRPELYKAISGATGIPVRRIVNEYGMTELLSQFYEPVLLEDGGDLAGRPLEDRYHVAPPWLRSRILDPVTLEPVPEGAVGILAHHDLANLGSVAAVLTEDRAVRAGEGFRLLGRSPRAEPRGCSLTMEEFLRARESVS